MTHRRADRIDRTDPPHEALADFQSIHAALRPRVTRYLARLVGKADAEDVTQGVMLRISEGLPRFRGESSLSTWVYRIATNAAWDHLRRMKHARTHDAAPAMQAGDRAERPRDELSGPLDDCAPSTEVTAMRREMNACIRQFLERLPESYRTVLVLGELEGLSNAEIADILGISLDAAKIRLHRGRSRLREALAAGCHLYRDEECGLACEPACATGSPPPSAKREP